MQVFSAESTELYSYKQKSLDQDDLATDAQLPPDIQAHS